ncbi:7,8-didemethyl-8-hydroxy-5-deazariboflavin synthase subunit CofG [Methanococcus voltae]|uniref:7,8-didemethyl-8-hydroxy-5-deazariboflavin synthase n=1 Tax=Methanococcus voltae (strain ATCC BAA-1334 / A3) TaxID=456320 RepID=D7DT41_METV3|nr:7,8-didemethyl-8-hydroxy-5-deazariboflavin synthase subunit CofG [Methanococcus voltae]MCS3901843.1 FO synthase subunit 1 [Methanococcus voltae]
MINHENALNLLNSTSTTEILENLLNLSKLDDTNNGNKGNKGNSKTITYSKNAFIPVCTWCRNICGYCTFREENYTLLTKEQMKETLREADKYNCHEALFTFGENVDENPKIMEELNKMGYNNIIEYLYDIEEWCLNNTDLLPHTNCGILTYEELKTLREVNASMGLMLENSSSRLCKTIAHKDSIGKLPKTRIEMMENAGKLKIPFTTGILIGIGETKEELINSIFEINRINEKYGNIQEVIIQNFRAKKGIPMENYPEPTPIEILKTIILSRMILKDISVQVPPNLNKETGQLLLLAGIDDWGGVSPITKDFVNPEAPWPEIEELEMFSRELGYKLVERLPVYEKYINNEWLDDRLFKKIQDIKRKK